MFSWLTGKKKPAPAPAPPPEPKRDIEDVLQRNSKLADDVHRRITLWEKKISDFENSAKEAAARKDTEALKRILVQKKRTQASLDKDRVQHDKLLALIAVAQEQESDALLIKAQKELVNATKNPEVSVEAIEKLQDDMTDVIQDAQEKAEIIGRPLHDPLDIDDELRLYLEADDKSKLDAITVPTHIPSKVTTPPTKVPAKPVQEEDDIEKEMAALMAG